MCLPSCPATSSHLRFPISGPTAGEISGNVSSSAELTATTARQHPLLRLPVMFVIAPSHRQSAPNDVPLARAEGPSLSADIHTGHQRRRPLTHPAGHPSPTPWTS
jgi:hypothetical protein